MALSITYGWIYILDLQMDNNDNFGVQISDSENTSM